MANYFMGIDPDMHDLPVVVIDDSEVPQVMAIDIIKVDHKFTDRAALVEMVHQMAKYRIAKYQIACSVCLCKALAVEGQELYQFGDAKTKNPKSIMFLATVAGMALYNFYNAPDMKLFFPTPHDWKGGVPKSIHQARTLKRLGWEYGQVESKANGYSYPLNPPSQFAHFKRGQWKHIVDAIGLALWARESYNLAKLTGDRRALYAHNTETI